MKFVKNIVRAGAIALAIVGGSISAKPAQADGGAVVAGIAGGLILGTIIGSTANAGTYYAPAPRYYAPAVPVYRPYYGPSVSFSFGKSYYGGKRYRHRGYGGGKRYYGNRYHGRKYRGGHKRHGFHRGHHSSLFCLTDT